MAANGPRQSLEVSSRSTALQDFVTAFNSCETPKDVLKLIHNVNKALTVAISIQSDSVHVSLTTMAGLLVEECTFPLEASVGELATKIQGGHSEDDISMTCMTFLDDDGAETEMSSHLKDHSRLTVKTSLCSGDVGRLMYQAGDRVSVLLLGQCLGHHGDFWKQLAVSYPENFQCFTGMHVVEAIRAYLWCFRLPGEAAQIERIVDGFARSYFHHNTPKGKKEQNAMADDSRAGQEGQESMQREGCWDSGVRGWYVYQPLSGPKLLPCCVHCGALDGEAGDLVPCQGCAVVHFCRKCRRSASRCGHAVVGTVGYGRACVAARKAAGTLGPDLKIAFQRNIQGCGELEISTVSEESWNWVLESPFRTEDSVMVLAYAIIMLTTNLHSVNVKEKMKKHEFIKQNREVNGGDNFPGDFLSEVYDDVLREELKVMRNVD